MSSRPRGQETCVIDYLIRKLSRSKPLSAEEQAALSMLPIRLREYSRGGMIVQQGSMPQESCLLMEGIAFRYKLLPDGARQIVSLQIPGDFVDLHSFVLKPIDHAVRSCAWGLSPIMPLKACWNSILAWRVR
jgi:CRP-like cAMP-binding protein